MNKNTIKTGLLLSAALMLSLVACNRVLEEVDSVSKEKGADVEVLTLIAEPQTKATLGNEAENPTKTWEDGDMIAVWAGKTETNGSFQNCSVFSSTVSVDLYVGTLHRFNYAVYPYKYTVDGDVIPSYNAGTGALSVTLPATYDYATVGGTKNPVPMVAKNLYTDGNDLTFYTVGALARILVSAIPSRASKLVVSFDKTVTGSFTVQDLSTLGTSNAPYIAVDPASSASTVTINLIPGADYIGAAINIPVPTGTVNVISVAAYDGETLLTTVGSNESKVITNWSAARAHGKKASVAYTRSIGSMIVSPGKVYTDGVGALQMAENWYSHMYVLSGATDDGTGKAVDVSVNSFGYDGDPIGTGYSIANRTHFNWNEMYHLFHGTALTWALASDNTSTSTADEELDYPMSKVFNTVTWRVPSETDGLSLFGINRPGATLNGHSGWKFVKILVTDMGTNGGTTVLGGDPETTSAQSKLLVGPGTTYQAGLLFLPDNVVFEDVEFAAELPDYNERADFGAGEYVRIKITRDELNNKLIAGGCAFFPAVGHWTPGENAEHVKYRMNGVGSYVCYMTSTQGRPINTTSSYIDYAHCITATKGGVGLSNNGYWYNASQQKEDYQNIRLVRDAFPVE